MTKTRTFGTLALAVAVTGALSTLGSSRAVAEETAMEKCYGIAKPGENGCAHAKGLHSCAGNSTVSYDGGDWKVVPAGTCDKMGGMLKPFEGLNPRKKA